MCGENLGVFKTRVRRELDRLRSVSQWARMGLVRRHLPAISAADRNMGTCSGLAWCVRKLEHRRVWITRIASKALEFPLRVPLLVAHASWYVIGDGGGFASADSSSSSHVP